MNKNLQSIFIACFLIFVFVSHASAQFRNEGKLNVWTIQDVQRTHGEPDGCLSGVSVTNNKGFDRLVFELDGGKLDYTISYLPSKLDLHGDKIKILGKVFMNIYLFGNLCESENYPKGKLKLPIIHQITSGVFENYLSFTVGLNAEKLYRVQELKNPLQLVIDFKH